MILGGLRYNVENRIDENLFERNYTGDEWVPGLRMQFLLGRALYV
jgi:hypothetical protein